MSTTATEPSAPWAEEPTTWIEEDYFPDKVVICQGTRAQSSAIRVLRTGLPDLMQQIAAVLPTPEAALETEPDEELRKARSTVRHLRAHGLPDSNYTSILDDEVTRLKAVVSAVQDVLDSADGEGFVTQADGEHVPVYLVRAALNGGVR